MLNCLIIVLTLATLNLNAASIKAEVLSPLDKPASYVMYTGFFTTALLASFFRDGLVDSTQAEITEQNQLGALNKPVELMGRWVPNILYIGGMSAYAYFAENKQYYKNAEIMFKATTYASLLTLVLKHTIRERRPNSDDRASFPSGHTTTAFAFAAVVADNHSLYWGIPAYAMATLVAIQRMNDNAHYLHDVIGGATIGAMYGIGISRLLNKKDNPNSDFSVLPLIDASGLSAHYTYKF